MAHRWITLELRVYTSSSYLVDRRLLFGRELFNCHNSFIPWRKVAVIVYVCHPGLVDTWQRQIFRLLFILDFSKLRVNLNHPLNCIIIVLGQKLGNTQFVRIICSWDSGIHRVPAICLPINLDALWEDLTFKHWLFLRHRFPGGNHLRCL